MKFIEIDGERYDVKCCTSCPCYSCDCCNHPIIGGMYTGNYPIWEDVTSWCPLREVE